LYLPTKLYGGVQPMFEQIQALKPEHLLAPGKGWSWGQYSAAVVVSAVGFSMWPHLFMKAFTARDERTLRRTVVLYPTFQLFLVPLFLIGFAGVLFAIPPDEPNHILPHLLMSLELPPLVVGLFCAGALAASMSSGDAMVHAAASIAVRDGWVRGAGHELSQERERTLIRWVVIIVMVLSYASALLAEHYRVSLVILLLSAYGPIVQFAPAVYAALYLRRVTGASLLSGMVAGSLVTLLLQLRLDLQPIALHPGLYGLVVNVIVVALVAKWWPARAGDTGDAFLAIARKPSDDR
jgi:SSS family solute:Na+ symporter